MGLGQGPWSRFMGLQARNGARSVGKRNTEGGMEASEGNAGQSHQLYRRKDEGFAANGTFGRWGDGMDHGLGSWESSWSFQPFIHVAQISCDRRWKAIENHLAMWK